MKEYTITQLDAGMRLDKYIARILPESSMGFIYKMLRKKNFVLNDKKADGKETLQIGDSIKLYLADETFAKFAGQKAMSTAASDELKGIVSQDDVSQQHQGIHGRDLGHGRKQPEHKQQHKGTKNPHSNAAYQVYTKDDLQRLGLTIIYEDTHFLILDKPAGMLSQKAAPSDTSVNEYAMGYLLSTGAITRESLATCKPSIANRLDRNTSGLILVGKTILGLQRLATWIKEREIEKYYVCILEGALTEDLMLEGYLKKDAGSNKVEIIKELPYANSATNNKTANNNNAKIDKQPSGVVSQKNTSINRQNAIAATDNYDYIETKVFPQHTFTYAGKPYTYAMIHLITGKPHQIRAHLASIGHPLVGDAKYGHGPKDELAKANRIKRQLLHAKKLVFPKIEEEAFSYLSEKVVEIDLPKDMANIVKL